MPFFALTVWPIIAMLLMQKMGRTKGTIWVIMIGALFLPEAYEYDLPGLPPLDKNTAILIGALLGLWATRSSDPTPVVPPNQGDRFARAIVLGLPVLIIISAVLTVLNNGETIVDGPVRTPGLGLRDLIAMLSQSAVLIGMYLVAQRQLADPDSHKMLLRAFVIAGLGYTLLILFEIRMSPQLHRWTYGYFQNGWGQHVRGGQFRPIVFLTHGLFIGIFLITCAMSAFILLKGRVSAGQPRMQYLFAGFWLMAVLLVSRNFGATLIAFVFIPILWFFGARVQYWVAVGVMAVFLVFPALRQSEIVTFERTLEWVGTISVDRQESFAHRLENEERFLERVSRKPVAGWGIWGRWRVRDPITGEDISTSDGRWMSMLGERGWLGFLSYFGLMMAPVFLTIRAAKRGPIAPETAGLGIILAATIVYQIANNTIGPFTMLMAGALAGFVWRPAAQSADASDEAETEGAKKRALSYSRFPTRPRRDTAKPAVRRRPISS